MGRLRGGATSFSALRLAVVFGGFGAIRAVGPFVGIVLIPLLLFAIDAWQERQRFMRPTIDQLKDVAASAWVQSDRSPSRVRGRNDEDLTRLVGVLCQTHELEADPEEFSYSERLFAALEQAEVLRGDPVPEPCAPDR